MPLTVGVTAPIKFHYSWCTAAGISPITARVVFVGAHSVVLEDVAGPLAGKIDADLMAMAQEFETVSYPLLLNFGDPARARREHGRQRPHPDALHAEGERARHQRARLRLGVRSLSLCRRTRRSRAAIEAEIFYARTVRHDAGRLTALKDTCMAAADARPMNPRSRRHHLVRRTTVARRDAVRARLARGGDGEANDKMFGPPIRGNQWRATRRTARRCTASPARRPAGCADGVIAMSNHFGFLSNYLQTFETNSILSGAEDSDIYGSAWLFARWLVDTYGGSDEGAFLRQLVQTGSLSGRRTWKWSPAARSSRGSQLPDARVRHPGERNRAVRGAELEPPDMFAGYAELGSAAAAGDAGQSTGGTVSVSDGSVKGGGAVLLSIGPAAAGVTQLLELKSTLTVPAAGNPRGWGWRC